MLHELDLLENAVDSLNEALAKYRQGNGGDVKAYKFCVLHVCQFFELVLKHYVNLAHPLLIFKKPFSEKLNDNSETIGLSEAINFLRNEGRGITKSFEKDLLWLKTLRNSIEHHKFKMNPDEVRQIIGRLIHAFHEFDKLHEDIGLAGMVNREQCGVFLELADDYDLRLNEAESCVADQARINADDPKFRVYRCVECGHNTSIPCDDSKGTAGYLCAFCGSETPGDDVEFACDICRVPWPHHLLDHDDFYGDGYAVYVCPHCRHDPNY